MGSYILLQTKRLLRYLPGAFCVILALLVGLGAAFGALVGNNAAADENQKVRIAIAGNADNVLLQMGLAAASSLDSTQFSLELVQMEEQEAHAALAQGRISAYAVLPEQFMEQAMDGNILPIRFVSTTGATGMVTIFKEEVSRVISGVVLEAQQGVYGMQKAMRDHDIGKRGAHMTDLAFTYVQYVLARDKVYRVDSLGIADALGLEDYLLCGLAVLFLLLCCLPFAPLLIRTDLSFARMLAARGRPGALQALADFAVYFAGLLALTAVLPALGDLPFTMAQLLPVVFLAASLSFLLYTLATDLIGGVLLQFFATLALCFVSGCMYPVYFFPVSVQKVAAWLPPALARASLSAAITGQDTAAPWLLLGYGGVFCALAVAVRAARVKEAKG